MSTAAGTTGAFDQGAFRIQLGNAGAAGGDMASVLNPFGEAVIITERILNITTQSTGASTIDVGVGASATTAYDTLIDGQSGAAAGVFAEYGTNGKRAVLWPTDQYLTVSEASGDVSGLAGELIIRTLPRTSAGAAS
jgi:hypothetical protein